MTAIAFRYSPDTSNLTLASTSYVDRKHVLTHTRILLSVFRVCASRPHANVPSQETLRL